MRYFTLSDADGFPQSIEVTVTEFFVINIKFFPFIKGPISVQHVCEEGWRHPELESRNHGNQEAAAAVCGGTEGGQDGSGAVQQWHCRQGLLPVWWVDWDLLWSPRGEF